MSPVFLFDVSVVTFLTRARECVDVKGLAIMVEMGIDKFRTIVGVNAVCGVAEETAGEAER